MFACMANRGHILRHILQDPMRQYFLHGRRGAPCQPHRISQSRPHLLPLINIFQALLSDMEIREEDKKQ